MLQLDSVWSWVGLALVGGAVAAVAVRTARWLIEQYRYPQRWLDANDTMRSDGPMGQADPDDTSVRAYVAPVVDLPSESNQGLFDFDAMSRSHDVHHPMDLLNGKRWHTWPAAGCRCNNGERTDETEEKRLAAINADLTSLANESGSSVALGEDPPFYSEPGYEGVRIVGSHPTSELDHPTSV